MGTKDATRMPAIKMLLTIVIVVVMAVPTVDALWCYTCTNSVPGPSVCEKDPDLVTTGSARSNCSDDRTCYIEMNYQEGMMWGYARGCDIKDESRPWEHCVLSHEGRRCDCFTACQEDNCNSGIALPKGYISPCRRRGEPPIPMLGKWDRPSGGGGNSAARRAPANALALLTATVALLQRIGNS